VKRKRKHNPLAVTGLETHFEAVQTVMAALTWAERGPAEQLQATEAVMLLDSQRAVMALWLVLNAVMSGFDSDSDRADAIRIVAEVMAKNEKLIEAGLSVGLP
jgi:hypothetical protein